MWARRRICVIALLLQHPPKDPKTTRLVSEIRQPEYCQHRGGSFGLENNLIKTHLPKYNILFQGRQHSRIVITSEPFPRIFATRKEEGKGDYYGPYPNVAMAHMAST